MPEKLKEILQKVMDWWNQFTSRQKTIIIGLGATLVFALAIVIYVTSLPQYVDLITCENAAKASEVQTLLDGASIKYKPDASGLKFSVESSQYQTAVWTLGSSGYGADEYTIQQALNGSISTTASDKEKLTVEAYQSKVAKNLAGFDNVKSAEVLLHIPADDGTLNRKRQESSAYIKLEIDGSFPANGAANIAKAVACWLGNDTTANITILDSNSNLLFAGGDDYTTAGIASSMQELQNQGQSFVANKVKNHLLGTHQFDQVEVACNLDMDFATYEETNKKYNAQNGRDEGYVAHQETFESENQNSGSYVPGTDSNDEKVYVSPDANNSSSSQNEKLTDYLLDEDIQNKKTPAGVINYVQSSMTVSMIRYHEYREEDVKRQGLLDGTTWAQYKLDNGNDTKLEVDPELYAAVAHASGIPEDNITILAYESPKFLDKAPLNVDWTNVASIVLLIIILALLGIVVLRSMSLRRQGEQDEELSVENLLQSTPEAELEDIDVEAKSETRKMIEKFVDENPEAAAALLRNWLSEDW